MKLVEFAKRNYRWNIISNIIMMVASIVSVIICVTYPISSVPFILFAIVLPTLIILTISLSLITYNINNKLINTYRKKRANDSKKLDTMFEKRIINSTSDLDGLLSDMDEILNCNK